MCCKSIKVLILFQIIAICLSQISFAEESRPEDYPWERVIINLGGFTSAVDSGVRMGTPGVGLDIDFEDALGLDSSTNIFRLDGQIRVSKNKRHSIDFGYYDMRRENTRRLQKNIDWNNDTYLAGTVINSYFNLQIFQLGYDYSYFLDERIDLSAGIGVFVMPLEVGIQALSGGNSSEDFTTPLPYLSLGFNFAITPKLFLKETIKIFYLKYDEFKGSMGNNTISLEYNFWKHIGIGLALDSMRINIKAQKEDYPGADFIGEVTHNYSGLMLYMKMIF
jgi:hypothetical protein